MRYSPAQILSAKVALIVLLAFQLLIGSALQAAPTASVLPHTPKSHTATTTATSTASADCPMHDSMRGATHPAGTDIKHSPGKRGPDGSHDCCQASACQCHCAQTPAAVDLLALSGLSTSVALPSLSSTQFVPPRIDEFLRPPIV